MLPAMAEATNPLVDDRFVDFLLNDVLDVKALFELPAFAEHSLETLALYLDSVRKLARNDLFPHYKAMDEEPARLVDGRVVCHPSMKAMWSKMVDVGVLAATRPEEVGGAQLPTTVAAAANVYLMAANLSAYGFAGLTTGAAHLIEAFGSDELKAMFMHRMYEGEWSGTMALTEPHAGSSLGDITTAAAPADDGTFRIKGAKIFISAGDHDFLENIVHLVLARIEGAPAGTKGISLFAVPRRRPTEHGLIDNDVTVAGAIHKVGWKGLPSLALSFGDEDDCHGWLVGEPSRGLRYMFQMMNEARIMVGVNGVATASAAYHEAKAYAMDRTQGRLFSDPRAAEMVPIIEHADVRRMLLRQKSIIEGGLGLVGVASRYADLSEHSPDEEVRDRSRLLLDLLTPATKTFPAEKGYEANVLAVQIHGGYGYSSEYLAESWLRDQKLNTIHEGTTGIQSLDLLGRKVVAKGGAALMALGEEVAASAAAARSAGVDEELITALEGAFGEVAGLTAELGQRGLSGDVDGMLSHSVDYLDLFGCLLVGWVWLDLASAAARALAKGDARGDFLRGQQQTARYFLRTEVPRISHLAERCRSAEDSYLAMEPDWF